MLFIYIYLVIKFYDALAIPVNALANIIQPKNVLLINEFKQYAISTFLFTAGSFSFFCNANCANCTNANPVYKDAMTITIM